MSRLRRDDGFHNAPTSFRITLILVIVVGVIVLATIGWCAAMVVDWLSP